MNVYVAARGPVAIGQLHRTVCNGDYITFHARCPIRGPAVRVVAGLQHRRERHGGIKICWLGNRGAIFQALQFAPFCGERKPGFRAMVCEHKRGSGEQPG